jgi:voltage-gated potassium channel
MSSTESDRRALRRERWQLLARLHRTLDPVFVVLSVVWIVLVALELATGSLPRSLELLVWVIWGLFVLEFAVGVIVAPARVAYVRKRWLTLLSLVLPALRIFRIAALVRLVGAARVARSVGLLRIVTSINRGLRTLGRTAQRRGLAYVIAATAMILVLGAAGMAFFEGPGGAAAPSDLAGALGSYADALWWTAYAMTTGAPTIPTTGEGRLLGWLLSIYGLAVFGYLTAVLASHFIGRDMHPDDQPQRPRSSDVRA